MEPFRLEQFLSAWEFKARFLLCASDMETISLKELLGLAQPGEREDWDALRLGYTEPSGGEALREAIARTYRNIALGHVFTFSGAQEAIFAVVHSTLEPGDHAIVVVPSYQSLETLPRYMSGDANLTGIALDEQNRWALDLSRMAAAVRPTTRLLLVNYPHNPTGAVLPPDQWNDLITLCRKHGMYLLSDEVYRETERPPAQPLPAAADLYERAISIGSLSKTYGLPGLRIAWAACRDEGLCSRIANTRYYLSICDAGPSQVLARIALSAKDRILARNAELVRQNLLVLDRFLRDRKELFSWVPPAAGCTAYIRCDGVDADKLCARAIEKADILLMPGRLFQTSLATTPGNYFRVGFGRAGFDAGMHALERFLATCLDDVRLLPQG